MLPPWTQIDYAVSSHLLSSFLSCLLLFQNAPDVVLRKELSNKFQTITRQVNALRFLLQHLNLRRQQRMIHPESSQSNILGISLRINECHCTSGRLETLMIGGSSFILWSGLDINRVEEVFPWNSLLHQMIRHGDPIELFFEAIVDYFLQIIRILHLVSVRLLECLSRLQKEIELLSQLRACQVFRSSNLCELRFQDCHASSFFPSRAKMGVCRKEFPPG
mmetsp:Transcript_5973/g.9971  ORF Transcript_5973/g.9971 Transcript_5973/m.9971 type:complete len:220 (+) Transcript_5973:121-780(+)